MESKQTSCSLIEGITILILSLILISLMIFYIFYWHPKINHLETFDECKMNLWKSCNLTVYENTTLMCYRIEGKNSTQPEYCQIVNQTTADCWSWGYYLNCVDKFEKFLQCFNNTELVINSGCPHCEEQIRILNNFTYSFEHRYYSTYFKIINLAELNETELEDYNQINSVPTWIINNKTYKGIKTMEELSELTGCKL